MADIKKMSECTFRPQMIRSALCKNRRVGAAEHVSSDAYAHLMQPPLRRRSEFKGYYETDFFCVSTHLQFQL